MVTTISAMVRCRLAVVAVKRESRTCGEAVCSTLLLGFEEAALAGLLCDGNACRNQRRQSQRQCSACLLMEKTQVGATSASTVSADASSTLLLACSVAEAGALVEVRQHDGAQLRALHRRARLFTGSPWAMIRKS